MAGTSGSRDITPISSSSDDGQSTTSPARSPTHSGSVGTMRTSIHFRHVSSSSSLKNVEIDLSGQQVESLPVHYVEKKYFPSSYNPERICSLNLRRNRLKVDFLDIQLPVFNQLSVLDLSENYLVKLPGCLAHLTNLQVLIAKNNRLDAECFPKNFDSTVQCWPKLETLNLSGNFIDDWPEALLCIKNLKILQLGANRLTSLPCRIGEMAMLERLYLGGNQLTEIPATIGQLKSLTSLTLSDNKLETIPSTVAHLRNLNNLSLHNNKLKTLPSELIKLKNLQQLSLRSNPLVVRFVRDMSFDPPTLKELTGRSVKVNKVPYIAPCDLPNTLATYLASAHHCVNPKCKGVYFEARVEHVKFVDFCGKYRLPFLQYLCSPRCSVSPAFVCSDVGSSSDTDTNEDLEAENDPVRSSKMKRVLLG